MRRCCCCACLDVHKGEAPRGSPSLYFKRQSIPSDEAIAESGNLQQLKAVKKHRPFHRFIMLLSDARTETKSARPWQPVPSPAAGGILTEHGGRCCRYLDRLGIDEFPLLLRCITSTAGGHNQRVAARARHSPPRRRAVPRTAAAAASDGRVEAAGLAQHQRAPAPCPQRLPRAARGRPASTVLVAAEQSRPLLRLPFVAVAAVAGV